jgi:hypothetical protein
MPLAEPNDIGRSARLSVTAFRGHSSYAIGDLKLFEPKTMCPFIAVRDRGER